jgi:plasmid stability protein
MAFDLFLKLDDEDLTWLRSDAARSNRSLEEQLRKLITEGAGHEYRPLTAADILDDLCPTLMFDLTRRD